MKVNLSKELKDFVFDRSFCDWTVARMVRNNGRIVFATYLSDGLYWPSIYTETRPSMPGVTMTYAVGDNDNGAHELIKQESKLY